MISFLIGLMIGGVIGVLVMGLVQMSKEEEE
jgi:gas vesicle protein